MDPGSTYHLEIRIVSHNSRGPWYELSKDVDADFTNFKDLVDEVVDKNPPGYGEIVKVFYFCTDSKVTIQVCTDQDLMCMFVKHKVDKCCFMTFAYHKPDVDPPNIPDWDVGSTTAAPCTPSIATPLLAEPSHTTQSEPAEHVFLANPHPMNEHVGVDDEGLYIEMEPTKPAPNRDDDDDDDDEIFSESEDDGSDDEIVTDRGPEPMPDVHYDKKNPPMSVGTIYSSMDAFKIALASHAAKTEIHYVIEKSDPSRHTVHCKWKDELGCKWRIHASTLQDDVTVQVKTNPYTHDCQTAKNLGVCVGISQFWVHEKILDWLKEDGNVCIPELRRRLKAEYKVDVPYRRVRNGKRLAMDEIYGPWDKSFDNLFRFKAQLEQSSPGSTLIIDHYKIANKERFRRLFFALKPCVDGFLRGCRPYLAVDSTFLTGRFRGQLCIACAVDGHNWMYPVAIGVIDLETNENWEWFMERLKEVIGSPDGLTFCTDCDQAVMNGVTVVFPEAEHRECMYHLVQNFKKRYSRQVFDDHLWAAAYTWNPYMFDKHYEIMADAKPQAMKYLKDNHKKLWTRSQFGSGSKVDYVTNNLAESFNNWIKPEKHKNLDDLLDTIRQKLLIKWNHRKRVAMKLQGYKILPHIVKKLREDSFNLDIDVITHSPEGVAEVCAKGGSGYRFVVNIRERICNCKAWQGSGIPCRHAIAYITSIPGARLEDYVDDYFSINKFKIAYEGSIPCIPDKSMWPKGTHGFFLYPPLLKSTGGGRHKNRLKSALEGGSSSKRQHTCPICQQKGHHYYTCKNGNPEDIAAFIAERGLPKKRLKKAQPCNTETSIVVATPSVMQFPINDAVENATSKKRSRKSSSSSSDVLKTKGSVSTSSRSGTGSNEPLPLQTLYLPQFPSDSGATVGPQDIVMTKEAPSVQPKSPRYKLAVKKKLTPRKLAVETATPSSPTSPASNTRSKKKLDMQ